MIPLIVIRAEPGASASAAAARDAGLPATACPLFEVRPAAWAAPPPDSFDALLIGSANAFRHGGTRLADYRDKPVYAVGEATALAARTAGFTIARVGDGGLQPLLAQIAPCHTRLLRLCGDERVALDPQRCAITERVVYHVADLPVPPPLGERLATGAVVMVHSAAAARRLAGECSVPARRRIALALIGPRLLAPAGTGWRDVAVAATPDERALLAAARGLCQRPA